MGIKIIEEKDNLLFRRKEIKAEIVAPSAPSSLDIEKLISEKFSTSVENIKLDKIKCRFGEQKFLILAKIYKSKEEKEKIEPKKKSKEKAQEDK